METKNEKKSMRRFRWSLFLITIICAVVFISFAVFMNLRSAQAISRAGQFYMQNLSEQIARHFETTISLRLEQVKLMESSVDPKEESVEVANANLKRIAKSNDFEYLAFMDSFGNLEMLYGNEIEVYNTTSLLSSIKRIQPKIAMGTEMKSGNNVVLLGVPGAYQMKNGRESIALIAGIPVDYISQTLSLEIDSSQTYSFIIRKDGSYVIRTENEDLGNYFDRVHEVYDELNDITPDEYLKQLKNAMAKNEPYSGEMIILKSRRQIYCVKLQNSDWYLLTFMPYGEINKAVDGLSRQWMLVAFMEILLIIIATLVIFFLYLKMNKRQMVRLEQARRKAENSQLIAETAQKIAEEAQKKAEQASRAKSEFLSGISHDIRTPMNAIVGMTSIACANLDNIEKVENCLGKIELSSKHLLGLINNVLDMSKIENGKMTLNEDNVSLRELMDNMVNIIKPQVRAKKQKFDVVIHDIISENVCCDSVRLNQVVINFLSNAVKFTPDGGSILMSLSQEPSQRGDDYVRLHLSVKDNGIGMSEQLKAIVFESFVREDSARVNHTEGTGLGMAITKYIIDAMGGTIDVESELGVGTEFKVTVDLKKVEARSENMVLPAWNVLVVDDDRSICESAVFDLKSMGVKAEWTLDGESAIKIAKENHENGRDYQFVLIDWKLPNMDGIETARRIHEILGEEVPILMISAYDCGEVEDEAREAGITEFISKPLFKSKLFNDLKKFESNIDKTTEDEEIEYDFSGKHVLLAEDNELNWEIAESLLSDIGLELDWAENGKLCLEMFEAAPAGYYDVVFMDIRMPEMNGYQTTTAIRNLDREDAKKIPIIAMTADAFAEDVKKCLDIGMNAHIAKPIDIHEIERLLAKYIGESNA